MLIPGPFLMNPLQGGVVAEGNKDTAGLIRETLRKDLDEVWSFTFRSETPSLIMRVSW